MAMFMTSSLMGLVGFELIGIAISVRIYRYAACVQRGGGRFDPMAVSRKFGDLAVNLGAERKMSWTHREQSRDREPGRYCRDSDQTLSIEPLASRTLA
jgi:hypothetical protein